MSARSKIEAYERIAAIDKLALPIFAAGGCSFSEAWLAAVNGRDSSALGETPQKFARLVSDDTHWQINVGIQRYGRTPPRLRTDEPHN